jgi:hypothetical protein
MPLREPFTKSAGLIGRPGDAWLAARMAAWRLALLVLKRVVALPRLARLMHGRGGDGRSDGGDVRIARLAGAVFGLGRAGSPGNCLARSLVVYRYLSAASLRPELVVGVRRDGEGVLGHAWVVVAGRPVAEPEAALTEFTPLIVFGEGGAIRSAGWPGPE